MDKMKTVVGNDLCPVFLKTVKELRVKARTSGFMTSVKGKSGKQLRQ